MKLWEYIQINWGSTQQSKLKKLKTLGILVLSLILSPINADIPSEKDITTEDAIKILHSLFGSFFEENLQISDEDSEVNSSITTNITTQDLLPPDTSFEKSSSESAPANPPPEEQKVLTSLQDKLKPDPVLEAYRSRFQELRSEWKLNSSNIDPTKKEHVFFQKSLVSLDNESYVERRSGKLTEKAVLALQLRYLIDQPRIPHIQGVHLKNLRVIEATAKSETVNTVNFSYNDLEEVWAQPLLDAFHSLKTQEVFSVVIRVTVGNQQHFITVSANKDGKINLIDPESKTKSYNSYILNQLLKYLNRVQSGGNKIKFRKGSVTNTGIQGERSALPSSSLYAFAYWSATLSAQDIDAYQSINGAYSDSHLTAFGDLPKAAVYPKRLEKITGLQNENRYDESVRMWLQDEAHGLN